MMQTRNGLGHRLWQAFIFQAVLISLTALFSVFAARYVLGDILIRTALEKEAEYFWQQYELSALAARPDTYNLTAYLSGIDTVPDSYKDLENGFHQFSQNDSDFYVVYVSANAGQRLWLVFDGKQVGELATFFGLVPLAIVLIVIYLSSWLAYRFSHQAVSPFILLARKVSAIEPRLFSGDALTERFVEDGMDQEVAILANALEEFAQRIDEFVERERNFTRDASHELRSPITVMKLATDNILQDTGLSQKSREYVERIKYSANDMEELIAALLLLARESEDKLSIEQVNINQLLEDEIERTRIIYADKPITINVEENSRLMIEASEKALVVLIGNILRNAFSYTDEGRINIKISSCAITIKDSGVGMSAQQVKQVFQPFYQTNTRRRGGYGVGLTIVKMLADRFNWHVSIDSEPDIGTQVTVVFPAHSVLHY
ncbi:MAG: HAMP domain-containing sensor histidine kinase [Pseudomonadota bacterium]